MRKPVVKLCIQSHQVHQFQNPFFPFCLAATEILKIHRLPDQIGYCFSWIQRCIRILKYDLHPGTIFFHVFSHNRCSIIKNISRCRFFQSENTFSQCRFSASAFSYNSKSFSLSNEKADIIHCLQRCFLYKPGSHRIIFFQIFYFQ